MRDYPELALDQIENANLTPARYRTARRLLDIARHTPNGQLRLQKATVAGLSGADAFDTARTHLIDLQDAGIIHYSINETVHISLLAWPSWDEGGQKRSSNGQKRAQEGQKRAATESAPAAQTDDELTAAGKSARESDESDLESGKSARESDESARQYTHASAGSVGWLVGNTTIPDQQDQNQPPPLPPLPPTDPPDEAAAPAYRPTETERAMSWTLLRKIGMLPAKTNHHAATQPFGRVRDGVAHWYTHRKSQGGEFDEEPRILNDWFENWEDRLIPSLAAWQVSDGSPLWPLRDLLFTPAELEAEARRIEAEQADWEKRQLHRGGYTLSTSPTPPGCGSPPLPDSPFGPDGQVDPVRTWALMQAELKTQIDPGAYDAWVADAWAVDFRADTGVFTVGLRNSQPMDWLTSRLKPKLQRALGSLLGGKITVEFVVIQGGPGDA